MSQLVRADLLRFVIAMELGDEFGKAFVGLVVEVELLLFIKSLGPGSNHRLVEILPYQLERLWPESSRETEKGGKDG